MRHTRLLIVTLFLLGLMPAFVLSQVPSNAGECPTVYVTGPAGVTEPGELRWFTATVKGRDGDVYDYDWVVSIGKITKRDGKARIGVLTTEEMAGSSLIATVRVKGLPEGCENEASESSGVCDCSPVPILIDEFSVPVDRLNIPALGAAVVELEKSRLSNMYIIEYFPLKTTRAVVDRKKAAIRKHLSSKHRFDLRRVTIVEAPSRDNETLTKIYSVPPGAENPEP